MTLREKVTTAAAILTLMSIAITSNLFLDARYAKADDLVELEIQTIKTMRNYRVRQMVQDLNGLDAKRRIEGLSDYDQVLKDQLERELKLETGRETD